MHKHRLLLLLAAILVAGCALTPKTPAQSVWTTWHLYTDVSTLASDLYENGTISRAQFAAVDTQTRQARPILEAAKRVVRSGGDLTGDEHLFIRRFHQWLLTIQTQLLTESRNG